MVPPSASGEASTMRQVGNDCAKLTQKGCNRKYFVVGRNDSSRPKKKWYTSSGKRFLALSHPKFLRPALTVGARFGISGKHPVF
jgi:hypothetical protein